MKYFKKYNYYINESTNLNLINIFVGNDIEYEEEEDYDIYELTKDAYELAKNRGLYILRDKELFCIKYDNINNKVVGALFISDINNYFSFDIVVDIDYENQGISKSLIVIAMDEFDIHKEAKPKLKYKLEAINPIMTKILKRDFGFKISKKIRDYGDILIRSNKINYE